MRREKNHKLNTVNFTNIKTAKNNKFFVNHRDDF